jgi:hypothetical protein
MAILIIRDIITSYILPILDFRISKINSFIDLYLLETLKTFIPLSKSIRKRKRELTNTSRIEIRDFFFYDSNQKSS